MSDPFIIHDRPSLAHRPFGRCAFSWLPRWGDEHEAQKRYIQCLGPFLQRFGSRVPTQIQRVLDALAVNYGAVRTRLKLAPVTLIHADLHLDNILFSSPGNETGLVLIDWQSVARGRGAIDLALFLFGSLETTARRTLEKDLLTRYHQLLIAEGVTGYDFPQLVETVGSYFSGFWEQRSCGLARLTWSS